jgi:lipopolysaccharide transport system permease protein
LKAKYAGSAFGILWAVMYPILFLGVYALVYVAILGVRPVAMSTAEYIVLIFCGLVPFLGFADALGAGVSSVTSSANLIKNTLFPIELVPLKTVLASTITQLVGTVLLIAILAFMGKIGPVIMLVPVVFVVQLVFTAGFIWFVSSLNVLFRDLSQITSVMIIFFMMVSPIGYTPDMIPEALKTLSYLNPLFSIIIIYRDVMFYNRFPASLDIIIFMAMSFVTFAVGFSVFTRIKKVFADNV